MQGDLIFLSREKRDRERERERKEKQPFSGDFTRFCRSELDRTRVKAALRDESYAWALESQDFSKVQVFTETEKRRYPGKSRKLRYGFYPTRFNFYLRACVCVSKWRMMSSFFFLRPHYCVLAITWPSLIQIE